jgi:hypothetical protein
MSNENAVKGGLPGGPYLAGNVSLRGCAPRSAWTADLYVIAKDMWALERWAKRYAKANKAMVLGKRRLQEPTWQQFEEFVHKHYEKSFQDCINDLDAIWRSTQYVRALRAIFDDIIAGRISQPYSPFADGPASPYAHYANKLEEDLVSVLEFAPSDIVDQLEESILDHYDFPYEHSTFRGQLFTSSTPHCGRKLQWEFIIALREVGQRNGTIPVVSPHDIHLENSSNEGKSR